jgi:hypothetical protein
MSLQTSKTLDFRLAAFGKETVDVVHADPAQSLEVNTRDRTASFCGGFPRSFGDSFAGNFSHTTLCTSPRPCGSVRISPPVQHSNNVAE